MGSKGKKIEFESKKTKLKQKTPRIGARKPYSQGNKKNLISKGIKKILFPRGSINLLIQRIKQSYPNGIKKSYS